METAWRAVAIRERYMVGVRTRYEYIELWKKKKYKKEKMPQGKVAENYIFLYAEVEPTSYLKILHVQQFFL